MKKVLKKVVLWLLKRFARRRLKKFSGKIVAVAGSIGKTSTKDAIFTVLNSQYKVKKSDKSMNTDFGLLLTILDIESGFSSITKWSWFLLRGFFNSFFKDCSEILLLEFGVDKPKDMDYLLSVVTPDIVVMTGVSSVHLGEGRFKDLQEIFDEKRKVVDALKDDGVAILNIDNPYVEHLAKGRKKKGTITFGKAENADYRICKISQSKTGISFLLEHGEKKFEVAADVFGDFQAHVLAPAIICAEVLKMDMEAALTALKRFCSPPGRMSLIPAINEAVILDSSYNSSPEALKAALKVLASISEGGRKVAVLGNMNDLGSESKIFHEMIGEIIPQYVDVLLTVGSEAEIFASKALEKGMDKWNVRSFKTASDAADYFKKKIEKNDIILVKGSQNNVRLERFVKGIMAHPEDAKTLLVRQERAWQLKL